MIVQVDCAVRGQGAQGRNSWDGGGPVKCPVRVRSNQIVEPCARIYMSPDLQKPDLQKPDLQKPDLQNAIVLLFSSQAILLTLLLPSL